VTVGAQRALTGEGERDVRRELLGQGIEIAALERGEPG